MHMKLIGMAPSHGKILMINQVLQFQRQIGLFQTKDTKNLLV